MATVFEWVVLPIQPLWPLLLGAAVRGTVVLAVAALLVVVLRRQSAAVRHGVWAVALLGCLALPALVVILPSWTIFLPGDWAPAPSAHPAQRLFLTPGSVAEVPSEIKALAGGNSAAAARDDSTSPPLPVAPDSVPVVRPAPALPVWAWLLTAWFIGSAVLVLPVLGGLASLRRLRAESYPMMDAGALTLLAQLSVELGLRRSVTLLQNARRSMPMTWGLWRPVILLPLGATSWSPERLRLVLLHELAHVRRWDCLIQVLAYLARALYWFHPLAWWAVARLRQEQERACDDVVLSAGANAPEYAEQLLLLTAGLPANRMLSGVALAVSRTHRIERRLAALLDAGQSHHPLTRGRVCRLALVAVGLLVPLASLRLETSAAGAASGPSAAASADQRSEGQSVEARKLAEAQAKVLQRYVRSLDEKEITEAAIRGLLAALNDPYCEYLSSDQLAETECSLGNTFAGIGVQIRMTEGQPAVVSPIEDSPALKAGLRPGDLIVAIDGKVTRGMTLHDVVRRILGPEGSVITLKVRRAEGDEVEATLTRSLIRLRTVQGYVRDHQDRWDFLLDPERRIGYVRITQFTSGTVEDLRSVLQNLVDQGLQGLVLDLRCCPGGLLSAAIESTRLCLARGTIVAIKGNQDEEVLMADGPSLIGDIPLVVLVNGATASAGEIMAGALKDNGRAVLLGSRSYGKGSVQELIPLEGGGTIRLTTAYYYLPSGRAIHRREGETDWGVDPTDGFYIPLTDKQEQTLFTRRCEREVVGKPQARRGTGPVTLEQITEDYADPQLAAALRAMIGRLATGTFAKVGMGKEALAADLAKVRRDEIRQRRDALRKDLERVNKELGEVEGKSEEQKP